MTCYNFILTRYGPSVSRAAVAASLVATARAIHCPPGACRVTADQQPVDMRDYVQVQAVPLFLGMILALLAIGTLAHVLLTNVRRRARELAIFKVLGMGRTQILGVVLWQAVAVTVVSAAAGLPIGLLAGRGAWHLFASAAGGPGTTIASASQLLAVVPAALLIAVLLAAVPGRNAGRIPPGRALRSE
jgi:ABC-type antimicrobial peptide transport system permease subunit